MIQGIAGIYAVMGILLMAYLEPWFLLFFAALGGLWLIGNLGKPFKSPIE